MNNKPLIGINLDYRAARKDSGAFAWLAAGYFDSVADAGGIPMLLPPMQEEDDLCAALDRLDGFVLIGGADIDAHRDGYMRHSSSRVMDDRRESFDRMLVSQILERRMPVFGIGAGMQLLNVAQGGNLFYHLPEDLPSALPHKDLQDPAHRHTLDLTPGSLMERIYGDGEIRVNSMHHMAVDEIAPGFSVTARCPDGVVEAYESEMPDWFVLGTQFHPEAESASALDQRLFEEFVEAVVSSEPLAAPTMRMVA